MKSTENKATLKKTPFTLQVHSSLHSNSATSVLSARMKSYSE